MTKIAITGVHGVGKSKICEKVLLQLIKKNFLDQNGNIKRNFGLSCNKDELTIDDYSYYKNALNIEFIPEQFREVVKDCHDFKTQTEEITLATYAKQLYLENLYTAQGKNILCDRSVLDTFVYYEYLNDERHCLAQDSTNGHYQFGFREDGYDDTLIDEYGERYQDWYFNPAVSTSVVGGYVFSYSKIYLIEPSDRSIDADGFRLTDKTQQLEIHKLFLEYFKDFDNVIIVNQEEQDKIVEMVVNDFSV